MRSPRRRTRPTFRVFDDDRGRTVTYGPGDYLDYAYSPDGQWLYLTVRARDGRPVRQSFYVGYPA